jgi:hypothetical protein
VDTWGDAKNASTFKGGRSGFGGAMDLPVHNQILWHACLLAKQRLGGAAIADPVHYFPLMVRGSWFNDTNQVSPFADLFTKTPVPEQRYQGAKVNETTRAFFTAYWNEELVRVLGRLKRHDSQAADAAEPLCRQLTAADDFQRYDAFDHLDVLSDEASKYEYDGTRIAKTVQESLLVATTRLADSTTTDASVKGRTDPASVSLLGRGLHTVADFFAHTNYVELLLWALREKGALAKPIQAVLDCQPGALPFDPCVYDAHPLDAPSKSEHIFLYAPVNPPKTVEAEGLMIPALWMNGSAAETPLASCVFDKQDTAYSMLKICARYLEKEKDPKDLDQQLDFLFSIMDVSGAPIPVKAVQWLAGAVQTVRDAFNELGRFARRGVANYLEAKGEELGAANNGDVFKLGADLMRKYDSAEASDWAQAGRLRYLAHAVNKGMGRGLARNLAADAKTPRLPHHTLLSKDHPSHRPDEQLRFALACTLATELSASVLMWHFGPAAPTRDGWKALRNDFMKHPSDQLGTVYSAEKLGSLATRCLIASWPVLLDAETPLEKLR